MIYHTHIFLDTECQLFSAIVAAHWNPDSTNSLSDSLNSHKCFSSWQKRNDISDKASITAAESLDYKLVPFRANDGFYCQLYEEFLYHSKLDINGGAWAQFDLKSYFKLKCIRVPVRSAEVYWNANFHEIEIRFGNNSRDENFAKNPIIAYTETGLEGKIFEVCLDYPLVGRYLFFHEKQSQFTAILIGDIQILV